MAYEKKTWVSGVTPLSAENMNHMEEGIKEAHSAISELNTDLGAVALLRDGLSKQYAAAASGSYDYRSAPGMASYQFIVFLVGVGNNTRWLICPRGDSTEQYIVDTLGSTSIRGGFYCDWTQERVYVRYLDLTGALTYQDVWVSGIVGISKIK